MIKTIIFDLDGVLVNTKKIHFLALNQALYKVENFKISYQEHLRKFDGLPTNKKIDILINDKKINKKNRQKIYKFISKNNF